MKITQQELKNLFVKIDQDKEVREIFFKSWPAWPLVKERLWLYALQSGLETVSSVRKNPIKKILNCMVGILEYFYFLVFAQEKKLIFAITPQRVKRDSFAGANPYFDSAPNDFKSGVYNIYYGARVKKRVNEEGLCEEYFGKFIYLLSMFLTKRSSFQNKADQLTEKLFSIGFPYPKEQVKKICLVSLGVFSLKYYFFGKLFKKIKPQKLVIQDPDGKPGEVLAAKMLGIETIEIQHGIFSRDDIDYAWVEEDRKYKKLMPVADKILVYGEVWRSIILGNSFYLPTEVGVFNCRKINFYRGINTKVESNRKILFFPTQNYVGNSAIHFWDEFLEIARESDVELWIKVHPNDNLDKYAQLSDKFKSSCRVFAADNNPYELIKKSDIVVGYTSSMLLEGLALGRPVINIKEKQALTSLCEDYNLDFLTNYIVCISTSLELLHHIKKISIEEHQCDLAQVSNQLYAHDAEPMSNLLKETV